MVFNVGKQTFMVYVQINLLLIVAFEDKKVYVML